MKLQIYIFIVAIY